MPKIQIEKTVSNTAKDTFEKIQKFLESDPDLRKMDSNYQCQFNPSQMTGSARGKQFDASFQVQPEASQSKVAISVNIPFLLTPLKGAIEGSLRKKLDRLFT
jgi:hypothetical protein